MQRHIPNVFTLLNLFLGCIAIVFALQTETISIFVDNDLSTHYNIPEKLSIASYFIFAAAVVDFLDGFVARLLGATSEMGKQLDSLSDVVSFGVAPSVILYQLLRISFIKEENGLETSILWLLPAFVVACAGAYRLARFNIDSSQSYGFKGVPIPAAGLLIASFPLILHYVNSIVDVSEWLTNKWVLYAVIVLVSGLMVSTLPLMALKFKDFTFKNNIPKVVLLVIAIAAAILLHWLAVPVVFIAYIILSLLYKHK
ncbi:CDP-diacylglycerol--serine O-phosphatidyltransferase [Ferruginibacter sp. SUN106]|uniref:CDP-diacylglycerol--serine O-phosphatidyltransferase n=1 Tax=Ferruginibacter sp. SUN106 TaxID=2978348 RepID=UPI003D368D23